MIMQWVTNHRRPWFASRHRIAGQTEQELTCASFFLSLSPHGTSGVQVLSIYPNSYCFLFQTHSCRIIPAAIPRHESFLPAAPAWLAASRSRPPPPPNGASCVRALDEQARLCVRDDVAWRPRPLCHHLTIKKEMELKQQQNKKS